MTGDRLLSQALEVEDVEFISELYREGYDKLLHYAKCVSNSNVAEDIVQDAFLLCTLKVGVIREHENPMGWMFGTIRNLIKTERRRQATLHKVMDALGVLFQPSTTADDALPLAMTCDDLLPESDWDLLYDFYCKGIPYAQLATHRASTVAACKMRVLRAKKTLKKYLKENA